MTWAKVDDRFVTDPDMLALPRGVRLLYIEGIVWCCQHLTDGRIPAHVVPRISDEPDLEAALSSLLAADLWRVRDDGAYDVVGFLDRKGLGQSSKAEVELIRDDNYARQQRNRRHKAGDHSACIRGRFCPDGAVTRDKRAERRVTNDSHSTPLRPTPVEVEGVEVESTPASAERRSLGVAPSARRPRMTIHEVKP